MEEVMEIFDLIDMKFLLVFISSTETHLTIYPHIGLKYFSRKVAQKLYKINLELIFDSNL